MSTAQRPAHKALGRSGTFGTANPIVVHRPNSVYPREELQRWGLEGLTHSHGSLTIDLTAEKECGFLMFEALPVPLTLCVLVVLYRSLGICGLNPLWDQEGNRFEVPVRQNYPSAHCCQG